MTDLEAHPAENAGMRAYTDQELVAIHRAAVAELARRGAGKPRSRWLRFRRTMLGSLVTSVDRSESGPWGVS